MSYETAGTFDPCRRMARGAMGDILRPLLWHNTLPMAMMFGAMSSDPADFAPKAREEGMKKTPRRC